MTYYTGKDLAESFRTVRKNTLQVAEDIPEDKYGFQAAPDTMTVAKMLAHLATSTYWAQQLHSVEKKEAVGFEDFTRYMAEAQKQADALATKAQIVAALKANGDGFAHVLEQMSEHELGQHVRFPEPIKPPSKSRFEMLLSVKEHEMHHRGQLMLVERMLGIVPHLTRARQNR
jgi:uncharacterized damage-inducible protein DinB